MKNIALNLKFTLLNNIAVNLLKFIVRVIFIRTLTIEYLGINGLFSNILAMLSLAELGIGPAIVYSLYKPLATKNIETIKSLMHIYKKVYIIVGCVLLFVGIVLCPWLDVFIKDKPAIDDLHLFYLVFLLNTAVSYFWSYQRNLLIADQKQYIVNIYQTAIQLAVGILQIIALLLVANYWYYIGIMLLGTIAENLLISLKAYNEYPYLKDKTVPLDSIVKEEIIRNIKAMILHKVCGIIATSSSNLVISKFVGLIAVGIYSNYCLITLTLNTVAGKFYETITASIGNAMVVDSRELNLTRFYNIELLTALQASMLSVGMYVLFNSFIELWVGKEYVFDKSIVACMVFQFYLNYMRKAVLLFKEASGLFWQDRFKPLAEAVISLVFSVLLTIKFGVIGVVLGGIISTVLTCFWVEPYVLFKFGFKSSQNIYYKNYFIYSFITIILSVFLDYVYGVVFRKPTITSFISSGIIITKWLSPHPIRGIKFTVLNLEIH